MELQGHTSGTELIYQKSGVPYGVLNCVCCWKVLVNQMVLGLLFWPWGCPSELACVRRVTPLPFRAG